MRGFVFTRSSGQWDHHNQHGHPVGKSVLHILSMHGIICEAQTSRVSMDRLLDSYQVFHPWSIKWTVQNVEPPTVTQLSKNAEKTASNDGKNILVASGADLSLLSCRPGHFRSYSCVDFDSALTALGWQKFAQLPIQSDCASIYSIYTTTGNMTQILSMQYIVVSLKIITKICLMKQ